MKQFGSQITLGVWNPRILPPFHSPDREQTEDENYVKTSGVQSNSSNGQKKQTQRVVQGGVDKKENAGFASVPTTKLKTSDSLGPIGSRDHLRTKPVAESLLYSIKSLNLDSEPLNPTREQAKKQLANGEEQQKEGAPSSTIKALQSREMIAGKPPILYRGLGTRGGIRRYLDYSGQDYGLKTYLEAGETEDTHQHEAIEYSKDSRHLLDKGCIGRENRSWHHGSIPAYYRENSALVYEHNPINEHRKFLIKRDSEVISKRPLAYSDLAINVPRRDTAREFAVKVHRPALKATHSSEFENVMTLYDHVEDESSRISGPDRYRQHPVGTWVGRRANRTLADSDSECSFCPQCHEQEIRACHNLPAQILGKGKYNPLYKTEMCRNWSERGDCRYGRTCQFAHGQVELRDVVRHDSWKTKTCESWVNGTCSYGHRCSYAHHPVSSPQRRSERY